MKRKRLSLDGEDQKDESDNEAQPQQEVEVDSREMVVEEIQDVEHAKQIEKKKQDRRVHASRFWALQTKEGNRATGSRRIDIEILNVER